MNWKVYKSIREVPPNLWDREVAKGGCITSEKFIRAVTKTYPEQTYLFFVAYDDSGVKACALLNIQRHDLSLEMPDAARKIVSVIRKLWPNFLSVKLAMTGTLESYGQHLWYDSSFFTHNEFISSLYRQIKTYEKLYSIIIFRDYILTPDLQSELESIQEDFSSHGFQLGELLPAATLPIALFETPEKYIMSLKSRDRYTIRKAIKNRKKKELNYSFIQDYENLLDECYPLYLAVNKKAKELQTEALPKSFFREVKKEFGENAQFFIMRDTADNIHSFALVIESKNSMNIFLVGIDYNNAAHSDPMYNILWECIAKAIQNRRNYVELGLTNYFIKERFGAEIQPIKIFFKSKYYILNRILPLLFKPKNTD